jgi:rod shape-determining protein MreC
MCFEALNRHPIRRIKTTALFLALFFFKLCRNKYRSATMLYSNVCAVKSGMNPIHTDSTKPVFMKRGWMPVWRFGIALTLSFILMSIDARFNYLNFIRQGFSVLTFPIQHAAAVPENQWWHFGQWLSLQSALIGQSQDLKKEQLQAVSLRTELQGLHAENEELRALLGLHPQHPTPTTTATFLYHSHIPTEQKIIIDQGEKEGIQAGQAVADSKGILGQITRVFPLVSEVTLLTNLDFPIPVKVARTGQFGVLYGRGLGHPLELRFTTQDTDLKVDDVLMTSGIDGTYPENLPVASVRLIERKTDTMFMKVECAPLAEMNQHKHMLIFSRPLIKERPLSDSSSTKSSSASKHRKH